MIKLLIISGVFPWLLNTFIGLFVYSRNPHRDQNRIFALFSLSIAFWSVGSFLVQFYPATSIEALVISKVCYSFGIFVPSLFSLFVVHLSARFKKFQFLMLTYFLSSCMLLFALWSTPYFFNNLVPISEKYKYWVISPGPVYFIFIAFFTLCVSTALAILFQEIQNSSGVTRSRYVYVFAAYLIASLAGGEYFSAVLGFLKRPPLDDYILVAPFILISIAILRHHLLDIEVIIKKTLVFAGIVTTAVLAIAIPFGLIQAVIGRAVGMPNPVILMVFGIVTTVLISRPVERFLLDLTDRYLFQRKFDYRRLLKEASQEMAAIKSLKQLSRLIVGFLILKGRVSSVAAYTLDDQSSDFILQAQRPRLGSAEYRRFHRDSPLIWYLENKRNAIEKNELENEQAGCTNSAERIKLQSLANLLKEMRVEAIVPSYLGHKKNAHHESGPELRSILLLGSKKSDEEYTPEDLDVFYTLAQESAIAIENARLYDEAIQRERQLADLKLQVIEKERKQTLGNLAGSIAHEINGPIQLIDLSTTAIRKIFPKFDKLVDNSLDTESRAKVKNEILNQIFNYLSRIDVSNRQQLTTATTIQRFSKKEDFEIRSLSKEELEKIEKHEIDLFMFLKLVVENVKIQCEGRDNYSVEMDTSRLPSHIPRVKMNQDRLERVITNLLLNAYDSLKGREAKKISISAEVDSSHPGFIHVEIEDTGCGIPPELKDKVWEAGFSTKVDEGKVDKGTGMGLYWCRFNMETVHPGHILFDSIVGVGTTFHLKIPIWKQNPSSGDESQSQ